MSTWIVQKHPMHDPPVREISHGSRMRANHFSLSSDPPRSPARRGEHVSYYFRVSLWHMKVFAILGILSESNVMGRGLSMSLRTFCHVPRNARHSQGSYTVGSEELLSKAYASHASWSHIAQVETMNGRFPTRNQPPHKS